MYLLLFPPDSNTANLMGAQSACNRSNTACHHLICAGTTFSDFERDHGAAMRLQSNAYATLVGTSFKRNTVTANPQPKPSLAGITGSAVAATNHSYVWILEVCVRQQVCFFLSCTVPKI